MNKMSWIPQDMPWLCLPLWWIVKFLSLLFSFILHPSAFLKKDHIMSKFKAKKRKEVKEDAG